MVSAVEYVGYVNVVRHNNGDMNKVAVMGTAMWAVAFASFGIWFTAAPASVYPDDPGAITRVLITGIALDILAVGYCAYSCVRYKRADFELTP